ncbi:MAG: type II toxin-antitoxin system RelE/ParE family toxin [Oceanicaulis sp.]|uniref:type II toxin-antitoxin system RelE/ParE family toxin n=1 Tax=Glycocaulis sp. TaxID=1969725 RepID=UPI0025B8FA6D|nr:type II toxin-antitoxin system RelE/ParE family toxin [Glycocaulis sp.]MCC5981964.1 type II toxin-antitoxin system RelE/ParE family toxin [Oceanicaulis sp.]MCH8521866.1 type II toxin-antitoxin system RelE/ParE family toxin [Glycocaulis sp.]
MAEFRLRPAARIDLENIWQDTAARWSQRQAETYVSLLFDAFDAAAEFPFAGQDASDIREGYRQRLSGSHVIFYRPQDYGVVVVRVLHGHMLPDAHF